MSPFRLLYLSNAFPPGVTGRFPDINPAGHATESRFIEALGQHLTLSTVGLLPKEVFGRLEPGDGSFGVEHSHLLWEGDPELWHRWRAWRELRRFYLGECAAGRRPDAVMFRNLHPVFHRFARWLGTQPGHPARVLQLADSAMLGRPLRWTKRLRYTLKPFQVVDDRAILDYEACVSFGLETRRHFEPRGVPWHWMPSASNFRFEPPPPEPDDGSPIRFGYFGALAAHASVLPLARGFLAAGVPGALHMCGFGKQAPELQNLAQTHSQLRFDGLLPTQAQCLPWAMRTDVLINPRLPIWGLENSFPSKIFEFAMTGRAILTTRTGGVDEVLGPEAFYLDGTDLDAALGPRLREIAATSRTELRRRGAALRERVLHEYNWDRQTGRVADFLRRVVPHRIGGQP
jgi:glycosyltransferase involved in cell wall biosynthesis